MDRESNQKLMQAVFNLLEAVHGKKDAMAISGLIHGMLDNILETDTITKDSGYLNETLPWSRMDHDLRTPMCGILGFAGILLEELKDPELKWKAEQIQMAAKKLMQLLEKSNIYRYTTSSDEKTSGTAPPKEITNPAATRTAIPLRKKAKSAGKKLPNILIVEDNMVNSNLLQHHIRKHCHIFFSQTGKAAIELAKNEKIDAIFMDINLGQGMDGTEAMLEIRKQTGNENLPIIAVTAFAGTEDMDKFLNAGFDDFIAKPFERQDVINVLDKLFR